MPRKPIKKRRGNGIGGVRWNEASGTRRPSPHHRKSSARSSRSTLTVVSTASRSTARNAAPSSARRRRKGLYGLPTSKPNWRLVSVSRQPQHCNRYFEHWLAEVLPEADLSEVTRDQYERISRLYVLPTIGRVQLDEVGPQHVRAMLTRLNAQNLSPPPDARRVRCSAPP